MDTLVQQFVNYRYYSVRFFELLQKRGYVGNLTPFLLDRSLCAYQDNVDYVVAVNNTINEIWKMEGAGMSNFPNGVK